MQLINSMRCSSSITQPPSPVPAAARLREDALSPCAPSQLHPEQTQPGERAIDNHVCRTHFTFLNRAR